MSEMGNWSIKFFLVLISWQLHGIYTFECSSEKCHCTLVHSDFYRANCSKKDLSVIPTFKDNVIDINLSFNPLSIIPARNTFPRQLLKLDLSSCDLRTVELGAFEKLKNIKYLDISHNLELTLDVLPNITNDLIGSNIETFKFNAIQCPEGPNKILKYDHLCRLQNTPLRNVEFSHNRIEMIEPNTIKNLPENLTSVSAGHNQLKFGWYLLEMLALKNLRFLNVSNMYSIENPFRQPWTVTCDDKHDQRPNRTPEGLVPCSNIANTKDTFNFEFLDGKVIMHMPPKLETLVIDNCIIRETAVSEHLEQKFKSLKILQANRNFVPHFQEFDYSNALQEVYLSRSFVSWFEDSFFLTSNLTVLDLSYNDLYHYFSTERSRQLLQKQEYLTNLNLASNRFEHVPSDLFKGLSKLNVLNLTENELTEVDFALNDLTELRVLDLSKNRIRTLTKSKMHDLDILSRKTTLSLNLTGNVLLCSCETLDFLKWMRNKRRIHSKLILANFKNYSCSFVNSTTMYFSEISSIILDLDKKCSSKLGYIIVSSGAVVIFMCCVVSGILYRYRWKLRYIYHMTRRSLRGYFTLQDTKGSARKYYEFDAFISYAEEDSEFSYNTLKSEILNLDPSVRLCYHQEHFVPGSNICENIVNAVHCSRKTICVVSKHFMESQWCKYEFNMAHMEKIHNRGDQNSLLFLMLGDIKSDYVPATMMVYLQSESYLKVPGNKEDSVTFWNHVYNAIIEE